MSHIDTDKNKPLHGGRGLYAGWEATLTPEFFDLGVVVSDEVLK
jgi:hypothetical protein